MLQMDVDDNRSFLYCDSKVAHRDLGFCTHGSDRIAFDASVFTPDEIAVLTKWTNTAVQERRLANLAKKTINVFLKTNAFSLTSAHVLARWPALAMLVDPKTKVYYYSDHERSNLVEWRRKFQEPVRNLKPYAWSPTDTWYIRNQKAMRLAETILTSAQMLPEKIEDTSEVKALVVSWRPLPGDLDKPE